MSTRPSVILMAVLRPDGLSRKARQKILETAGIIVIEDDVEIDDEKCGHVVGAMEARAHYNRSYTIEVTANYWQERKE